MKKILMETQDIFCQVQRFTPTLDSLVSLSLYPFYNNSSFLYTINTVVSLKGSFKSEITEL